VILGDAVIDTIIGTFPISPTLRQLQDWVAHPLYLPDGKVYGKYFQKAALDNGAAIGFVYYPPNPKYPDPWLQIKVSLPKVLFGTNIAVITEEAEIEEGICVVNKFISGLKWVPNVDLGEGVLWRVDPAFNYQVGDRVQDYITAFFKLSYPERKTKPYLYEGVQFRSPGKHPTSVSSFYDKQKESLSSEALGYLRHEGHYYHTYYLGRLMGIQNPTLRDLKISWLVDMLQKDLDRLRLKDTLICTRDLALDILQKQYGSASANRLYGHLIARQSITLEQMIARGTNIRSIQRWDKLITSAGVALTMTDKVPLPPLIINLNTTNMSGSRK
jgi:hypothetical protein